MAAVNFKNSDIALRPEIIFSNVSYKYEDLFDLGTSRLTIQKIEVPILLDAKLIGPLRFLVGPSFQFLVNSDYDFDPFFETDSDAFAFNGQIGFAVRLNKFDIDLRWEFGLTESNSTFDTNVANARVNFDTKPNQIMFGLTYRFLKL